MYNVNNNQISEKIISKSKGKKNLPAAFANKRNKQTQTEKKILSLKT